MTGFTGYLALRDETEFRRACHGRLGVGAPPLPSDGSCCIAEQVQSDAGLTIGISGQPLFRGKAIDSTGTNRALHELLEGYRKVGVKVLKEIEGAFSVAILDPSRKRAVLAVDRMGTERVTYAARPDLLAFSRQAGVVAGFPEVGAEFRNQAWYDFLFMHMVPGPQTVYSGIQKLAPGTALVYENGICQIERYWTPSYNYASKADEAELIDSLHSSLAAAVSSSGLSDRSGAFLSGGLDSSSIVGTLARVIKEPAQTFTIGFGEEDYDELKFAHLANERFGCNAHEYTMKPADIVDAFPRIAAAYDEPFGNSSAAPTFFCAKLAHDSGVNHLLAGDGGDELFGGNERYTRHAVFQFYEKIPAALRRSLVDPASRMISPESRITPLRKFRSYVDQAQIPLPERFESWNFMYREGQSGMLDSDFAASIDPDGPMKTMRNIWNSSPSDDLLETMLWYDWHITLADNDLRKVSTMCELAGVRVSYPMLHPDVVNLSLRIPSNMKIRGMELRSFFKKAMTGFLPDEIVRKKKHGFGLPFGLWLKTDKALGDLIYSNLADLKKRHIIDATFIDNLIAQHRAGHASYFGYAIWDLAMLEAWMAKHIDGV